MERASNKPGTAIGGGAAGGRGFKNKSKLEGVGGQIRQRQENKLHVEQIH